MIQHVLHLEYKLSAGWLQPFASGLQNGNAVGRRCSECGRVSFAPLRSCDCGSDQGSWLALPGLATVEIRTVGADGDFGLVKFDGADTRTVARLLDFNPDQGRGAIVRPPSALPAVVLRAIPDAVSA